MNNSCSALLTFGLCVLLLAPDAESLGIDEDSSALKNPGYIVKVGSAGDETRAPPARSGRFLLLPVSISSGTSGQQQIHGRTSSGSHGQAQGFGKGPQLVPGYGATPNLFYPLPASWRLNPLSSFVNVGPASESYGENAQSRSATSYDSFVNALRQYFAVFTIDPSTNGVSLLTPLVKEPFLAATAKADIRDGADVPGLAGTWNVNGEAFFHQENVGKEIYTMVVVSGLPPGRTFNVQIHDGTDVTTANCAGTGVLFTQGGFTGIVATNVLASNNNPGSLSVVQRTPITALTVAGVPSVIGRSVVITDAATGATVGCGLITVL